MSGAAPGDLAIIIVSYNTRQLTADCLTSVFAALEHAHMSAQVWVVDNASPDGSAEMVRLQFPQVRLIAHASNVGFAAGNNLALARIAEGPPPAYVLFLNPDTLVTAGALPALRDFLQSHLRAAAAGAQLMYGDGAFQHAAFHFPTLAMAAFDFWPPHHRLADSRLNGRYPRRLYRAGAPFAIDHPLGAAMMLRWEALQQVGWFDEGYFMYCEEIDWCWRAKKAGWEVYCVPAARIVHLGGQSARQFREAMYVALWRSRYRLFERHYSPLYRALVRQVVRAGLRTEMRRLRRQQERGQVNVSEVVPRMGAYRAVMAM